MTFPVTHSIPSIAALLSEVASQYAIAPPTGGCFLNIGVNDTFLVRSARSQSVLRVYRHNLRTLDEIHYELEILQHLKAAGVAVAAPIARKEGRGDRFLTAIDAPEGQRWAAMFEFAPGRELEYGKGKPTEPVYRYGRMAASLHAATVDFASDRQRASLDLETLLAQPLRSIQTKLCDRLGRSSEWPYFSGLARKLRDAIAALPDLDWGFCHGDLHGGNAHIDGEIVTPFDFDCCGLGWRAYDLAVFKRDLRASGHPLEIWEAFLRGYGEVRALGERDRRAIELFVPVRHLWMLGLHVDNGDDWGFGWLGEEYLDRERKFLQDWEAEFGGML